MFEQFPKWFSENLELAHLMLSQVTQNSDPERW